MRLEAVGFGCVASAEARESKVCFLMNQGEVEVHVLFDVLVIEIGGNLCVCCLYHSRKFLSRAHTNSHSFELHCRESRNKLVVREQRSRLLFGGTHNLPCECIG